MPKAPKDLQYKPRLVYDHLQPAEIKQVNEFAERYKKFLDAAKTEREAVREIEKLAIAKGFKPGDKKISGARIYLLNRGKNIALLQLGKKSVLEGVRLIASHIDAPRLDLKQNPLYQELDLAFLKTHYYGGIKKYQWLSRPLALHGVIIRSDGQEVSVCLGEEAGEPVFTILDLLPHLARQQMDKKLREAVVGEKLNILAGSLPEPKKEGKKKEAEKGERVKSALLNLLHKKYGITEEDFISSELEAVPAGRAVDVGFDAGLVGAYGHDDRVCSYAALEALLDSRTPEAANMALFLDKEEIGSDGNTGAQSNFLEYVAEKLVELQGLEVKERLVRQVLRNMRALSADVNGAVDPDYQEVHEKRNAALLGYGVCLTKFTGGGGKYGANDTNAEFLGWVRRVFNEAGIIWQTGELGKVDEGGGGTIAKFLAAYGMEVLDCGTALLGMHSPLEVASKTDIYMTYRAYAAFFQAK